MVLSVDPEDISSFRNMGMPARRSNSLEHGSLYSQWGCRELVTVLAQQTGIHLGREGSAVG
jgi:hypothetical protein